MDSRIQKAKALIEENLQQDLKLDRIAEQVNISCSRLRHLFKDHTGATPIRYQKRLRLQKAKQLLESTFLNVKEIMFEVGIRDGSNFVRDFKKQYSLSPVKYRAQFSRNENELFGDSHSN